MLHQQCMERLTGPTDHSCPGMRARYPRFLSSSLSIWSVSGVRTYVVLRVSLIAGSAAWQGMELPIPWEHEPAAEGPQYEVKTLVALPRLPPGVRGLRNPCLWEEEEVLAWRQHILLGQRGALPEGNIFQFLSPSAVDEDDQYCEDIHPSSTLRYSPFARLWVARLLLQAPEDLLARAELVFQIPVLDSSRPVYQPLCDEDMAIANENARDHEDLLKLLVYMGEYEEIAPVQVSAVGSIRVTINILR
jgi:hypothetical protein